METKMKIGTKTEKNSLLDIWHLLRYILVSQLSKMRFLYLSYFDRFSERTPDKNERINTMQEKPLNTNVHNGKASQKDTRHEVLEQGMVYNKQDETHRINTLLCSLSQLKYQSECATIMNKYGQRFA